jgi:hypothetical protein
MRTIMTGQSDVERMDRIRRSLILGMPPLAIEDQRWLYQHAFGETLEKRTCCKVCHGVGTYMHRPCISCDGVGVFGSLLDVDV